MLDFLSFWYFWGQIWFIFDTISDLDVDNQTDGGTMLLSGPESDSDSDVGDIQDVNEDIPETTYIHSPESEFGAVSFFFN